MDLLDGETVQACGVPDVMLLSALMTSNGYTSVEATMDVDDSERWKNSTSSTRNGTSFHRCITTEAMLLPLSSRQGYIMLYMLFFRVLLL